MTDGTAAIGSKFARHPSNAGSGRTYLTLENINRLSRTEKLNAGDEPTKGTDDQQSVQTLMSEEELKSYHWS